MAKFNVLTFSSRREPKGNEEHWYAMDNYLEIRSMIF